MKKKKKINTLPKVRDGSKPWNAKSYNTRMHESKNEQTNASSIPPPLTPAQVATLGSMTSFAASNASLIRGIPPVIPVQRKVAAETKRRRFRSSRRDREWIAEIDGSTRDACVPSR